MVSTQNQPKTDVHGTIAQQTARQAERRAGKRHLNASNMYTCLVRRGVQLFIQYCCFSIC